ncbi:uncharacterized protein Bfra_005449 [Botrytis fragariae]|uniref:Uncharacterized protein n=1 Tax=Botrytis fragariae TaxID=1964551 RepID=A0A8H6AUP5_9HELO|nr:uncharacterized protein Bfra_005449 [Botrytis fragariae]KAF5873982.1 hypothetical protein Bfra_005449 [Botrytis fragariae]
MAAKKKKATAAPASRLPAGTVSLSTSKVEDRAPSAKNEELSISPQQVEEMQESWPLQAPMIEYESCEEKCAGWGSNTGSESEDFLDDDMDFLPTGWGKNDKQSSEDMERVEIARKAKMKKKKSHGSALVVAACREKTVKASDRKVELSRTLVELTKPCANTEIIETALEVTCHTAEQVVSGSVVDGVNVVRSTSSLDNSCVLCTSRSSEIVTSNTTITKSTVQEPEPNIKLMEKMARQERDLKSAKTQAGSLRAEIEVLNQKHRLEMQKQLDQLNESHRKEMDAMKLDLEEAQTVRQKALADLQRVEEKNLTIRMDRKELNSKLGAVNRDAVRFKNNIVALEAQSNHALKLAESFSKLVEDLTRKAKATELRLDAEQANTSATLLQQNSKLLDENRRLKQQQSQSTATSSNRLKQLQQKYDSLASTYHSVIAQRDKLRDNLIRSQRQCQVWKDEAEYYNTSRDDRRAELDEVAKELTKMTAKYEKAVYNCNWEQQNYDKLKQTYDIVEPLVKIGADIRLRFLDQAREAALSISWCEADMALRTNGNVAAHRGNAAADATLFKGKLIPEEYKEEAEEIFEKLYNHKSSDYPFFDRISERQNDCEATLATITKSSVSATLREEWRVIWNRIVHGPVNKKMILIEELERLTDEIVDLERSNRRRR